MALFNYATKEITLKIVYYGPGLSGKTTNLQYLHATLNPETKGKLLSLSTEADRTLFFDFLPVEIGKIRDFSIRFQLYTVPGQVRYNATRRVVLKGADAIIFVADSQAEMKEQNIESLENMIDNLHSNNINPDEIPIILQYNKRDLKNILSIDELNNDINSKNYHYLESSAINGTGVEDSYKLITKLLLKNISRKHNIEIHTAKEEKEIKQPEVVPETVAFETSNLKTPEYSTVPESNDEMLIETNEEAVPEYNLEAEAENIESDYDYNLKKERDFSDKAEEALEYSEFEESEDLLIPKPDEEMIIEPKKEAITGYNLDAEVEKIKAKYGHYYKKESNLAAKAEQAVEYSELKESEDLLIPEPDEEVVIEPKEEAVAEHDPDTEAESIESGQDYDLKKESDFSDKGEQAVIKEVPVIPIEKIDKIVNELEEITKILSSFADSVSTLNSSMSNINNEIIKIKEIKKEQIETNMLLKNIINFIDNLKIKKKWFKL